MSIKKIITDQQKYEAACQIRELRKEIDYDTRDYTIDFLIQKLRENDLYIPDEFTRKYTWNSKDKNRFIESIILGLPVPPMFFCETHKGRCRLIDGAQRVKAIDAFVAGDFVFSGLNKLTALNGFSYQDLPFYFRTKFNKTNIRVIILSGKTTLEIQQEVFNRINATGHVFRQ